MAQLPLTNVINVSVSAAQTGIGEYSVNNLALFTHDAAGSSFGTSGYQLYLSPTEVGSDFGTTSETYALANQVFSQQPNILAGGGYLAIITYVPGTETLTLSGTAASGSFTLVYGSVSAVVNATDSASTIQTNLRALTGLSQVTVANSPSSGSPMALTFYGVYSTPTLITTSGNTLKTAGSAAITITPAITGSGETMAGAITRTTGLVQYFGILQDHTVDFIGSTDTLAAAAVVQPLNKMLFLASHLSADLGSPNGILYAVTAAGYSHTRGLYYGGTYQQALGFAAAYAGKALSTNFTGNNTTQTMHLKDLIGVTADNSMTQTLLATADAAGADVYVSLQGVAKVFTSGTNQYFDQVYNLQWIVGALQVAGFNYLAESATKIPQTESGMTGLKGAYRAVCQQGVTNQYLAPGSWTSSTTFGNQGDFLTNIGNVGYYIYSQPVSQQSQTARAARQAPLVQIAVKQAGAIQSSDVIIYVNA